jgi:hypothetical protein
MVRPMPLNPKFPRGYRNEKERNMKAKYILSIAAAGSALGMAQGALAANPATPAAPQVTPAAKVLYGRPTTAPPMAPTTPALTAPAQYVWDGYQYVGIVDGQYYALGANNVWMPMTPAQLRVFFAWQRANPNWAANQIRNTQYPNVYRPGQGTQPAQNSPGGPVPRQNVTPPNQGTPPTQTAPATGGSGG